MAGCKLRLAHWEDDRPCGKVVYEYNLPPRGIVEVISRERVVVPDDLSGSAMVKTSLCNQGILALGIGLIDPGWDGPISSFLINFGKVPHPLAIEDIFLRTTFHTLEGTRKPIKIVRKEADAPHASFDSCRGTGPWPGRYRWPEELGAPGGVR